MPNELFDWIGKALFFLIAMVLVAMGLGLVLAGSWEAIRSMLQGEFGAFNLLNSIGLIIVSVAVIDLAKFVLEEYVLNTRQLRSMPEARRSLTKFMTIIIIAFSLESLVATFEVGREEQFEALIYPAALMVTAVLALVGLGAFQWLTRAGEREMIEGSGDPVQDDEVPSG